MGYVSLGRSGIRVSRYILGTLTFAGTNGFEALGNIDVDQARTMVDMALDAGINAFDTANLYSKGDAENVLGEALIGRRDQVLLFSKGRSEVEQGPNGGGASRLHLTAQLEGSLKRLKTDWLDLYFVHQWDGLTPIEETVETMSGFVKAGKIRYWGVSNYSGWALAKTALTAQAAGFVAPVAHQIYYTPEAREAEYELLPAAEELGIGSMVWSPLGQGLFGGRVKHDGSAPGETRQGHAEWKEPYVSDRARLERVLKAVEAVARETGRTVPQVTLAWLRARPGIGTIVLGARTGRQLADNLASDSLVLSPQQSSLIEAAGRPAPLYPFWHRAMWGVDRPTPSERAYLKGHRQTIGI
ncbi:aldo/keto reductase [Bradyrhizobium elkanii]|jgi:aryl-alcohol dehydrogenase-like predicted oxidoreductase|uniref:aldo/keto reductase n=1 Tax=Bradyrhizobium elkanii TaxID=29448 RepID=UPI0027154143|nr:aldo/keto reductase [Bradyrhizobium elkanii]WLA97440.1 aldo/keto reductase [Bradyrhizobium elkanii]